MSAVLLVHLASFAAFVGAGFAQTQFVKASRAKGLAAPVRDAYEQLGASIVTRIELPALVGSLLSGATFVAMDPGVFKQGWFHGKLTCVILLAVLAHLEMFNARRIVRMRAASAPEADIDARKARHGVFGRIGGLLVVAVLVLVTVVRLG